MTTQYAIITLTHARTELATSVMEGHISAALAINPNKVTVMCDEEDVATIIVYPDEDDASEDREQLMMMDAGFISVKLNELIQSGEASAWANLDSICEPANDEEEISLEEEEAYEIWQNIPDEERTSHLDVIPNPDGVMIRPSHHHFDNNIMDSSIQHKQTNTASLSPCELQMKRDPSLLNFDNVSRVDIAEIHTISSWDKPVVITNAVVPETQVSKTILDKQELKTLYGNVNVRTGNRETLIDNGFMNSIPKRLVDALEETNNTNTNTNRECGTIVFSPIQELPDTFIDELRELMDAFPSCTNSDISILGKKKKFTLTIASEGFGIGMHKHNAAMFMLLVGRKKWYMTNSTDLDGIVSENETHPRFYRELSSHKCIQQPGEVLYVPNDWYHEIFNLEYTLGIQALPE